MKQKVQWFAVARQRLVEVGAVLAGGVALVLSSPTWADAAQASPGAAAQKQAADAEFREHDSKHHHHMHWTWIPGKAPQQLSRAIQLSWPL